MANQHFQKKKGMNPKLREMSIQKALVNEVQAAKSAGINYGLLASRLITIMIHCSIPTYNTKDIMSEVTEVTNKLILEAKKYPLLKDIPEKMRELGYNLSNEEIVKNDPTLGAYLQ